MNRRSRGVGLMLGSAASWAFGILASKSVLDRTDATSNVVLTIQLAASVGALAVVCASRRRPVRPVLRHGWTGLFEPGLAYQLSLAGLARTSGANATVLASLEPVVVPFIAVAVLRYRPSRVELVMPFVATGGAIAVSFDGAAGGANVTGDLLVFAGVVAAAFYVVISQRHVFDHDPFTLALVQQLWALVMTVGVLVVGVAVSPVRWPASGAEVLGIAASGLCNYALPFTLYLSALRHLHVTDAAPFLAAIPAFGLFGAVTVLGEAVSLRQVLGAAVVVVSLIAITRRSVPSARPPSIDERRPDRSSVDDRKQ